MRTILTDFLSVPKTIGIGPIIITPAALVFRAVFERVKAISMPIVAMIMPAIVRTRPTLKSVLVSIEDLCSLSFQCVNGF